MNVNNFLHIYGLGATYYASKYLPAAAQHGHAADGALRPQDRGFFEGWNQLDTSTDLWVRRR